MKKLIKAFALFLLMMATPAISAPPPPVMTKADVDNWLDGFLPFALQRGDIAGAVVVVVKDGQVLTQRGFGYADVARHKIVDPERTLFRPGSVSKLITWSAVMQQVEAGKIDLDADVNKYLDFNIPAKDGKPITMRQLMTHTSGFEEHGKATIVQDIKWLPTLADYAKRLPNRIYAAGTTPSYSNYGTGLAAYIVQRVTKMPFEDYVEQHIFRPLGMANSTMRQPLPAAVRSQMATGYKQVSAGPLKFEFVSPTAAGGLSSTGADMARFMIAHLNQGAGLMKPETARLMHDSPTTIVPPLNRMELGFFETNGDGRHVIGHLGDTAQFHTALHLYTDDDVGLYMSFNSMGDQAAVGPVRRALFEQFTERYLPKPAQPDGQVDPKLSAQHARMMVGHWQNSRRSETNFFAINYLLKQISVSVAPNGDLVVPVARNLNGKPMKLVEIAPFVWRNVDGTERLAAKVADGKVVRWSMDSVSPYMVFDRVPASQSAAWIVPMFLVSTAVLLLTFLHWPISALIRRRYKARLDLPPRSRTAYRAVRAGAGLVVVLVTGWVVGLSTLKALPSYDPLLWLLQIGGLIILIVGVLVAIWYVRIAMGKRGWFGRLWSVLVLLSVIMLFYMAWTFGLLSMSVNY